MSALRSIAALSLSVSLLLVAPLTAQAPKGADTKVAPTGADTKVAPTGADSQVAPSGPTDKIVAGGWDDAALAQRLASLDVQLTHARDESDARFALWEFGRAMQGGQLSRKQEAGVLARLDRFERTPSFAAPVAAAQHMIGALSVGKVAPEIAGADLDGVPFKLSDYRGKVVVLMFSGEWCGICRAQYPYERLLLDVYRQWPFAIVGVESGSSRAEAKAAMAREHLTYRAFWDGGGRTPTSGPIATAWNAVGWPSVYVIDAQGVIRAVDVLQEDLLRAVRRLETAPAVSGPRKE